LPKKEERIKEIEKEMQVADFWLDQEKAKKMSQELAELKDDAAKVKDIREMAELLGQEAANIDEPKLQAELDELEKEVKEQEMKVFFSGPYAKSNALLTIYAGAGGTEAQDWSEMLLRMYLRYAERRGFRAKVLSIHEGQEAGIKNATIEIRGRYAYNYLKGESGVHRLVRLSPFNANNLRHTSFSLIEVLPEIEEAREIKIKPEDLRVDTYRSSGPGGQYVNKTESAVRITHIPTNIMVSCQSERSQGANKEQAMKMLYTRLYQLELKNREKEIAGLRSEIQTGEGTAEWGSQIRNYVLHPYKLVKDLRTGVESKEPERVLDGELDEFIEAEIKMEHI